MLADLQSCWHRWGYLQADCGQALHASVSSDAYERFWNLSCMPPGTLLTTYSVRSCGNASTRNMIQFWLHMYWLLCCNKCMQISVFICFLRTWNIEELSATPGSCMRLQEALVIAALEAARYLCDFLTLNPVEVNSEVLGSKDENKHVSKALQSWLKPPCRPYSRTEKTSCIPWCWGH